MCVPAFGVIRVSLIIYHISYSNITLKNLNTKNNNLPQRLLWVGVLLYTYIISMCLMLCCARMHAGE